MSNEATLSKYSFPNSDEMCEAICHLIKRYL